MLSEHRDDVQRFVLQKSGLAPDSPSTGPGTGFFGDFGRRTSARTRGNGEFLGAGLTGGIATQEVTVHEADGRSRWTMKDSTLETKAD